VLARLAHAHVSSLPDRMVLAAVGWNTVSFSRMTGCCMGARLDSCSACGAADQQNLERGWCVAHRAGTPKVPSRIVVTAQRHKRTSAMLGLSAAEVELGGAPLIGPRPQPAPVYRGYPRPVAMWGGETRRKAWGGMSLQGGSHQAPRDEVPADVPALNLRRGPQPAPVLNLRK
jgi:hypothetical protein